MRCSSLLAFAILLGACRAPEEAPPPGAEPEAAPATPQPNGAVATPSPEPKITGAMPSPSQDAQDEPSAPLVVAAADDPREDAQPAPQSLPTRTFERPSLPAPMSPVKPSRIAAGEYQCKISREYRFRPCTVSLDEHGRSILTVPEALINIEGVLTDDGKKTRFDGILTNERPFGCFSCQEICSIEPSECFCKEMPPGHSAECIKQPIRFDIRKKDGQWRGRVEHRLYHKGEDAEGNPAYETDKYIFVMRR